MDTDGRMRRRMADGGWWTADGGWRMADGAFFFFFFLNGMMILLNLLVNCHLLEMLALATFFFLI